MVVEMVNTAIERMVDLIVKSIEKIKDCKDVAVGIFLTAIGSVIVGILIFLPHVLKLFR
jgi:diacylglycerol kinase